MKKIKQGLVFVMLIVFSLMIGSNYVLADSTAAPVVEKGMAIMLDNTNNPAVVQWQAFSTGSDSFAVTWSKSASPAYPARFGDQADSLPINSSLAAVTAFLGDGTYYVRVCAVKDNVCEVYSNQITVQFGPVPAVSTSSLMACPEIYEPVCGHDGQTYANQCYASVYNVTIWHNGICNSAATITSFIAKKIITTISDAAVKAEFKKVYLRNPNLKNIHDAAAIKIMTYGLQKNRNAKTEAAALKIYKAIFKKSPVSASDQNILAAIAYSGAKR